MTIFRAVPIVAKHLDEINNLESRVTCLSLKVTHMSPGHVWRIIIKVSVKGRESKGRCGRGCGGWADCRSV